MTQPRFTRTRTAALFGADIDNEPDLTPDQQDAYQLMLGMLRDWGLEALGQTVYDLLIQGFSQENISLMLRDTDAYKARFAANETRKRLGLPVLSPAEYLSVERSYRQVMSTAGIPAGFWDDQRDFDDLIGRDISPMELQRRVDYATERAARIDANTADWFGREYGLDFADLDRVELTTYLLDPERGMDVINRVMRGGTVAGAARGRGIGLTREQAERFGAAADDSQYSVQAAQFAEFASRGSFLSDLYGGAYGVEAAGQDVFAGSTSAAEERRRLQEREKAAFEGGGSAATSALKSAPGDV